MTHTARPTFIRKIAPLIVLMVMIATIAPPAFAGKPGPKPVARTVCIDAGHGGRDSGAFYGGLKESDLTLDIADRLRTLLINANAGFTVVMTREPGQDLSATEELGNTDRANICNGGQADTVLSIHLNASGDPGVDYFKAFFGKQTKDGKFTTTISDNYKLTKPYSTEPLPKNTPTQFASGLLLKTNAPASMAETVFLSNEQEQIAIKDPDVDREQEIANNLFNGLWVWYNPGTPNPYS